MSFKVFIQETRGRALSIYPDLNEQRRYRKMLDKYSESLLIWFSATDHARFNDLRIRLHDTTRRRIFCAAWDDIRKYGTSDHPFLESFFPAADLRETPGTSLA